jgi:uncharacterized protein (TIGR02145 family)
MRTITLHRFIVGIAFTLIHSIAYSQLIKEIKIGDQVWMAENLNVFYFQNGDPIPIVKSNEEWCKAGLEKKPACCYYNNSGVMGEKFGLLYNWYAVNDPRGLAPNGWHIPSDEEWTVLSSFLGGDEVAGNKLKSTNEWAVFSSKVTCDNCLNWSPQQIAGNKCIVCGDKRRVDKLFSGKGTDESGFNALPGGFRFEDCIFYMNYFEGYWWSITNFSSGDLDFAYYRKLENKSNEFQRFNYYCREGMSVRCIKD